MSELDKGIKFSRGEVLGAVGKETYGPLSEEIFDFVCTKLPKEPSPVDLIRALGAMEAIRFGIVSVLESKGFYIQTHDMTGEDNEQ